MPIHFRINSREVGSNELVHGLGLLLDAMASVVLVPAAVRAEARYAASASAAAHSTESMALPLAMGMTPPPEAPFPARAGKLNEVARRVRVTHLNRIPPIYFLLNRKPTPAERPRHYHRVTC